MTVSVFIGLGSNLQKPQRQIEQAVAAMKMLPDTDVVAVAPLYRSVPMGPSDQPDYINTVAQLETSLEPAALLEALQAIEHAQGRVRHGERWGARTLDLDILVYGNEEISDERLIVPHPGIAEREFVLYPLNDIAASLMVPGLGRVSDLRSRCPANGIQPVPQQ